MPREMLGGFFYMKKTLKFTGLALILLCIFACTIPSKVEVRGTPRLKFAADMDFSDIFSDMLKEAFNESGGNDIQILEAVNSPSDYKTFVIRLKLFDVTEELLSSSPLNTSLSVPPGGKIPFIDDVNGNIDLMFSNCQDWLNGFDFNMGDNTPDDDTDDIKAYLYMDGSRILDHTGIEMLITDGDGYNEYVILPASPRQGSEISPGDTEYGETSLPDGGRDIPLNIIKDILTSHNDLAISNLSFYVDGGKDGCTIESEWLEGELSFNIEMVIWFPLSVTAGVGTENDGSTPISLEIDGINYPGAKIQIEELDKAGEFIQDFTGSEMDIIESLKLELGMTENHPLKNGWLVIQDTNSDFIVKTQASDTSVNLELKKEDIETINNLSSFTPSLTIFFEKDETLGFPKELKITNINVEAGVNAVVFGGE